MIRKRLSHEIPETVPLNPQGEVFFITICCMPQGVNQLATEAVWRVIDESLSFMESAGHLKVRRALAMPDHLHGLFGFPGMRRMPQVISGLKSWVAKNGRVRWQRDFFDHRLRSAESGAEKAEYIRQNPVRAGLVACTADWPYQR